MAPFSIPAPAIIPLRLPVFGASKTIDTSTKVELLCETYIEHEIFYTLDGTRPQPYSGIVQGSKTIKYTSPFTLPAGKITIKALAINSSVHTMCSSVVTKCFEVTKVETDDKKLSPKVKTKNSPLKKPDALRNKKSSSKEIEEVEQKSTIEPVIKSFDSDSTKNSQSSTNCFENAFIASSDFDDGNSDNQELSVENESGYPVDEDEPDGYGNLEDSEDIALHNAETAPCERDSEFEAMEKLIEENEKNMKETNTTLIDSGTSIDTVFCCIKCDLTLQQCFCCNKMNAVSSKFCIGCGKQLIHKCAFCKEYSPSVAVFCQYCGKKLGTRLEPYTKVEQVDHSILVKPLIRNASTQELPTVADKCTQTRSDKSPIRKSYVEPRRLPRFSPGKGYWHQQMDYICNHLKSHAYNNIDFRKEISEPSLCDFKSAQITKDDENNIVVTVTFTPFVPNKSGLTSSEGVKSKEKEQDSS